MASFFRTHRRVFLGVWYPGHSRHELLNVSYFLFSLKPRIVAIDYGQKRVGIAVTDPLRLFAQPVGTFSPADALEALKRIQDSQGLGVILLGWPLLPDGSEGKAVEMVQAYLKRIQKAFPDVEILLRDERYTSERARQVLYASGVPRKQRRQKGRIDTTAASLILQDYLDEINPVILPP